MRRSGGAPQPDRMACGPEKAERSRVLLPSEGMLHKVPRRGNGLPSYPEKQEPTDNSLSQVATPILYTIQYT